MSAEDPQPAPAAADASARAPVPARRSAPVRLKPSVWESWDDERLLDLRLCDLDLHDRGTGAARSASTRSTRSSRRAASRFRPHFWLSDEWFCPDGVPGIAIPFYLAHPRLARLEQHQMLEVEGGTHEWCAKILRHEAGHAIENAYRAAPAPRRQRLFGRSSQRYPEHYTARPYSKSFVVHLDAWYAQSHPDEDFAETFAVWLTPGLGLARPLRRLARAAEARLRGRADARTCGRGCRACATGAALPPVRPAQDAARALRRRKRAHYGVDNREFYDRDLRRCSRTRPSTRSAPSAAKFLSRIRKDVRRRVRQWTREYQYTIDQVLGDMIARCRELDLRLTLPPEQARARVHRAPDRAGDELPAQRPPPAGAL